MNPAPQPRGSRAKFWIVVALFFTPLLAAFALYYGASQWRPHGRTNQGELIDPPRPIAAATLPRARNGEKDPPWAANKWTIAYVGAGSCDDQCRTALVHMRQTRLALGKELVRVQRVFLITAACCAWDYLDREHEDLIVVDAAAQPVVLNTFPKYGNLAVEQAGRIYIIDPLGNLMMSYAPNAPSRALLEDLKKLLKLSHVG